MAILNKPTYWFQTKAWRIALVVIGTIVVLGLVVFGKQIGNLLKLFGSKAGIQTETVQLDHTSTFLPGDSDHAPQDNFKEQNNRLMLNDTGQ